MNKGEKFIMIKLHISINIEDELYVAKCLCEEKKNMTNGTK